MKKTLSLILILVIIAGLVLCLFACRNTTYNYKDYKKYKVASSIEYSKDDVKSIDIAWAKGVVNVTCVDGSNIKISEENSLTDETWMLHYYLDKKGKLWIKPYASKIDKDNIPAFEKKILTVTLPKKMFDVLSFENHNAEMTIDGIQCRELHTYNNYSTRVTNAVVTESAGMSCSGLSGICSLNGAIGGDISISASDSVSLYTTTTPNSVTMSGQGHVTVYLPENIEGFKASVTTVSQMDCPAFDIHKDSENADEGKTTYVYGTGKVQMNLSCKDYKPLLSKTVTNKISIYKIVENGDPAPDITPNEGGEE